MTSIQGSADPAIVPSNSGRIYRFTDKTYYSPNCTRDSVRIPVQATDRDLPKNIFLPEIQYKPAWKNKPSVSYYDFSGILVEDYQFPRWWTDRWGWTAFIPRMLDFKGADGIFYPLGERIVLRRKKRKWRLADAQLARLCTLETGLITAIHHLAALTGASIIYPPPPRVFGYQKGFGSSENATQHVERSRRWFLVWLGLFSYLTAVAETKEESLRTYSYLRIPEWTKHLQDNGFQQTWVDNILSSAVCSFDTNTPRAGIFVKFKPGPSNQPSIDWYCQYSIPVWYELTKDSPVVPNKVLARSRMPTQASNPPATHSTELYPLSDLSRESGGEVVSIIADANSEWKAFFAARDTQNTLIIAKEGQLQKQNKSHRENAPVTISAKVFEWRQDDKGVYRRQAVLGKYKLDILEGYTKNQTRYDAIRNEWDCCVAFAPNEDVFNDDDCESDAYFGMDAASHKTSINMSEAASQQDHTNDDETDGLVETGDIQYYATQDEILYEPLLQQPDNLRSTWRSTVHMEEAADWIPEALPSIAAPNSNGPTLDSDLIQAEILQRGYRRYGFAPQVRLNNIKPLREEKQKKNLMQVLGFRWYADKAKLLHGESISHFSDFLDRVGKAPVSHLEWDLGDSHTNRVALIPRSSTIRIVTTGADGTKLYMFDRDSRSSIKWNLAMTTAAHALMVCRLDAEWDTLAIARYLLGNGIPFRTLQRSDSVRRASLTITAKPLPRHPMRPAGYVFTAEDYRSYRERCEEILHTARGRVALMMGGHLWRIVVAVVSFDDALSGPSGWYTDSSKMLVVTDPQTGEEFIDDQFTEIEAESLCGMNLCFTGNGEQLAKMTWYPLPKTLQYSGQDYGCWTDLSEGMFLIASSARAKGVDQLDGGENTVLERQPIAVSKWRDLVRGSGSLRRLNLAYSQMADKFIVDNCSR